MGVLLLGADHYGTLAAARCYGRNGIEVTVADERRFARAMFSRYVGQRFVHPQVGELASLVDWLVHWGERHPGTLLYPTTDGLAWLFAAQRERLGRSFAMLSPSEQAIIMLLDKKRLHDVCRDVGIEVPQTCVLGEQLDERDGTAIAEELRYPVLLKPRTQVYLAGGIKGFLVRDRAEFASQLARFRKLVSFNPAFTATHPEIVEPLVQEYLPAAETSTLSVSGFVGDNCQLVTRTALKVLQRPRKLGIGLCFEGRAAEGPLITRLAALCRRVGYQGAFESEFVVEGDRRLLIDFNPRFYSQMGFEAARGLSLPLLVWYAARGEQSRVADELSRADAWRPRGDEVYCHKTMLDLMLALQRISGQMPRGDVRRWRAWHTSHMEAATDAVRAPDDRMPARVDTLRWATDFAKHPRSFVLNR